MEAARHVFHPASNGHEYELLTRAGKVGADGVYRFKEDNALKPTTAHLVLPGFVRDLTGKTILIELELGTKDEEWWAEKLVKCGFQICPKQTWEVRQGTNWSDVWVCYCP